MDRVLTSATTTITKFKGNPNQVVNDAGGEAFAVLSNNRPTFYVVPPSLFAELMERLDDFALAELVQNRRSDRKRAVKVDIADL